MRQNFTSGWMLFMAGGMIFTAAAFVDERMGHVKPPSNWLIVCVVTYGLFCLVAGIYEITRMKRGKP